jgi:cytochrome c oxidase subunit 2
MSFSELIKAPEIISTNGHLIDELFGYTTTMNVIFFTLVCIGLFGFSYLYSAKRNKKVQYTYGNMKKQQMITGYLIGASVFLLIDLNITRLSNDDMVNEFWNFPKADEEVVKVEVLAQQWMWNFRYAGTDGEFNTGDDILTNHELHVPVGKKIEFRITSKDVIHSFYLPNARLKVDAIPGRVTRMWVQFKDEGNGVYNIASNYQNGERAVATMEDKFPLRYPIACAEMCGTHHYQMQATLIAHSEESFALWLEEAQHLADTGNDTENPDNFWGWKWETEDQSKDRPVAESNTDNPELNI